MSIRRPAHRVASSCAVVLLPVLLAVLISGCTSPLDLVDDAEEGGRHERWEALQELALLAGDGRLQRLDDEERALIERYVSDRYRVEPNPSLRAALIRIAMDGGLESGPALVRTGFTDPELAVRLEAVEHVDAIPPSERRSVLKRRLQNDDDPLLRIAAARAYREVGDPTWVRELVEVIIDPRADSNVRFQAYLSAIELTGADLMFLREDWQSWLEEYGS